MSGGCVLISKRLGEDWFFSGAFVDFRCISAIFRLICLEIKVFFVYLQSDGAGITIAHLENINAKKL
jgi:hypothetical protein